MTAKKFTCGEPRRDLHGYVGSCVRRLKTSRLASARKIKQNNLFLSVPFFISGDVKSKHTRSRKILILQKLCTKLTDCALLGRREVPWPHRMPVSSQLAWQGTKPRWSAHGWWQHGHFCCRYICRQLWRQLPTVPRIRTTMHGWRFPSARILCWGFPHVNIPSAKSSCSIWYASLSRWWRGSSLRNLPCVRCCDSSVAVASIFVIGEILLTVGGNLFVWFHSLWHF